MKAAEIRQKFIRYFEERGHTYVAPSSVVPLSDPTLLFTNAGMNQFKDVFLDTGSRPYSRAVNSQPCIRVSGKHNDLEEVGHDTYHHTLFEMLGNWSFGDYYKKEAIIWAWELLTGVFGISKKSLYATVHYTDKEAAALWQQHTDIIPSHILEFGDKDNFWEMGETGPCGPCSEIHIDLGPERCDKQHEAGHICGVNGGCARYIELWNLVFIQYNRATDGTLHDLPRKHVDTGAGLERLSAVLNNLPSNYDVDLFADIIRRTADISGAPYSAEHGVPHRVIADHVRTLVFSISDGVIPSNDGRGYVIRRLLRRAARYGRNINLTEPFLYKLVPTVIGIMGEAFPRLKETEEHVARVIKAEEESFNLTLDKGIDLFNELANTLAVEKRSVIAGIEAFRLYDTYGFPVDLTILMARERGLSVDTAGFEEEMNKQKDRARTAAGFSQEKGPRPTGGEAVIASNEEERLDLARHHTSTHLLQAALRKVLGTHVTQAGSYVAPDRMRFDFTHFQGMTDEEIGKVESLINEAIMNDLDVCKYETGYEEAVAEGAMALFGEKYGAKVRVVEIGDFSKELCGGNHLDRTGQIGILKIISEGAVASGIRRIEAVAGAHALSYLSGRLHTLSGITRLLKVPDDKAVTKVQDLLDQVKQQEKHISKLSNELLIRSTATFISEAQEYNGSKVIIAQVPDADSKSLLNVSDNLLGTIPSGLIFLASVKDGKVTFVAKASKDMIQRSIHCGDLVKSAATVCGGGGGGSAVMAQAGGKVPEKIGQALAEVRQKVEEKLR